MLLLFKAVRAVGPDITKPLEKQSDVRAIPKGGDRLPVGTLTARQRSLLEEAARSPTGVVSYSHPANFTDRGNPSAAHPHHQAAVALKDNGLLEPLPTGPNDDKTKAAWRITEQGRGLTARPGYRVFAVDGGTVKRRIAIHEREYMADEDYLADAVSMARGLIGSGAMVAPEHEWMPNLDEEFMPVRGAEHSGYHASEQPQGKPMAKARMIIGKAIEAPGQSTLVLERVQVRGHIRGNVFIRPAVATRRKVLREAPHQNKPVARRKPAAKPQIVVWEDDQAEALKHEIETLGGDPQLAGA